MAHTAQRCAALVQVGLHVPVRCRRARQCGRWCRGPAAAGPAAAAAPAA